MIVGVTGGIGAGKSTVCQVFEEAGALVIDADAVGHETILKPEVIRALADAFGDEILGDDGQIVRRELGKRAFASDAGREKLNAIVWRPLRDLLKAKIQVALVEKPERLVVVDAALLVERGDPKDLVDVLVVVTAPVFLRITRTKDRLGISEDEVKARLNAQLPESEKVAVADFVVVNDETPIVCQERALAVWNQIVV
ncbi:MAG: dephospho-CoA kinase [Candidatus Latescibacteria bacterium]|nr:dephospho-CoA kinase [Candidatus Latescibacterota bacterium]